MFSRCEQSRNDILLADQLNICRMKEMDEPEMAADDGLTIEGRLHDRMFRINDDIRSFGNLCSAYRKRGLIGKSFLYSL